MCLNSVGLAVMGMVGHEMVLGLATPGSSGGGSDQGRLVTQQPLWEGTLRVGPGVARGGNVTELGGSIVKAVGGLPLTARDIDRPAVLLMASLRNCLLGCLDAPTAVDPATKDEQGEDCESAGHAEQNEEVDAVELAGVRTRSGN